MTRKLSWVIVVCLAQLANLPGCAHLPYFTKRPSDGPAAIHPHKPKSDDAAVPPDKDGSNVSKMFVGPPVDENSHLAPPDGPVRRAKDLPKLDVKKPNLGAVGFVTADESEEPTPVKPTSLQTPAATPTAEKKREDALLAALKAFLDKRHDDALQHLREFDNDTQEFIIGWLPALAMVARKSITELTAQEIAVIYAQIKSAEIPLRKRCDLAVSKICFCKDVQGYARYSPLPSNHAFVAGYKDRQGRDRFGEEVCLYVELKNLLSEKTSDGDYLTRLSCSLELYDAANQKVWSQNVDRASSPQRRRAPMHDFYRSYVFYVPAIPPGTYRLTMQIADETNPSHRRVARESLAFRVTPAAN